MSWRFPDKRSTNTGAMGVEDTNDGMLPVTEEVAGRLNEQNWAANAFTSGAAGARFSKDMAYRHFRKHAFLPEPDNPSLPINVDLYQIPVDSVWHVPVDSTGDTLSHTFDSVGGLLYVCSRLWIQTEGTSGLPILAGIKVNGALLPESICGNVDVSEYTDLQSTGINEWATAMSEIVIPIPPGRTTVESVVRTRFDSFAINFVAGVGSRSLILWEIAR